MPQIPFKDDDTVPDLGFGAFTPGPWSVESIGSGYSVRGDGNAHCVAFTNTASCSKAALRKGVSKDEEEQSNARLIAAAPDLLAALIEAHDALVLAERNTFSAVHGDAFRQALAQSEAAIKKARGE